MSSNNGSAKILSSRDYRLFKLIKGNRPIDENHVRKLMKSMRNRDLLIPITVNSKMEILDGQHRFEARKRLAYAVPYYVGGDNIGLQEVQSINASQKGWTNRDFCQSFIALGKKDYEVYQWFLEKYRIPHVESVKLLMGLNTTDTGSKTGAKSIKEIFQGGEFQVRDLNGAKMIAEMLREIEPFFSHWTNRNFVAAICWLLRKKAFAWKRFIAKVEMNPTLLQVCVTRDQYIDLIERIYNYKAQDKVSLKYGD